MDKESNQEVEVVLEEAKTAAEADPKVEVVDEEPPKEVQKTPDEGIAELKKRFEAEKAARYEAEQRAKEAQRAAHQAKAEASDANYHMIVNAIETVQGRADALRSAYTEAMNVGDYSKAAEIQEAIAVNANRLNDLKQGEKSMKAELEKAQKAPVAPVEPPKGDLVDQLASQVSPKSSEWLRNNRDSLRDERAVRRMFRAHEDAVEDGVAPDSDEYFEYIEKRLGIRKEPRHEENPMSTAAKRVDAPPPPPAPVTRGGSNRPNVVRLTRDQAEIAKMMGMTEAEYAKNMLALQKEGKLH